MSEISFTNTLKKSNQFVKKHHNSPEYCPQSNGKAERINRTLIEKARCMIISQEMNLNLWGAARQIIVSNQFK